MKAELAKACWEALADTMPNHITMTQLAEACGISYDEAILHGGDVTHLILHQLEVLDDEALSASFADFAEDPDASSYDKIFEGLIMRFEVMAPSRKQFANIHNGAIRAPLLAMHCLHQFHIPLISYYYSQAITAPAPSDKRASQGLLVSSCACALSGFSMSLMT